MKTNDGIIQYGSKADYLAKKPTVPKIGKTSNGVKSIGEAADKVDLSETAKEVASKAKDIPKKVEAKAKETAKAGKHLLDGAGAAFKKALKTPGLSNLMPNLGGADGAGGVRKSSQVQKNSIPKTLNQPAVIFVNGYDLSIFDSETGLDLMASNVPRSEVFNWDQEEEILDMVNRTALGQPVIMVGHGMGGDTAVEVTNRLNSLEYGFRKVDLLVTLDSTGFENDIIPQNVAQNLNVITDEASFFSDGPNIARNTKTTKVTNELRQDQDGLLDEDSEVQFMVFDKLNNVLGDAVRKRNAEQTRVKNLIDKILPS